MRVNKKVSYSYGSKVFRLLMGLCVSVCPYLVEFPKFCFYNARDGTFTFYSAYFNYLMSSVSIDVPLLLWDGSPIFINLCYDVNFQCIFCVIFYYQL